MRLGDLDALKEAIETWDKFACLPDGKLIPFRMLNEPEKNYEPYVHLRDIQNAIDNAPIVQPKYFPPCEDCNKKMEEIRRAYDKMKAMERPQGETNAEIFQQTFGIYATELWSMKEADFLKWLNAEQD